MVESDSNFRAENPDITVTDYALELIDSDIEYAIATKQYEWKRELLKVRRSILND